MKFNILTKEIANGDGQTELAIGNGATTSSLIVAPVDLYAVPNVEDDS